MPKILMEILEMTEPIANPISGPAGTELTRFNALRHGVLSRYVVLPWEDADEYGTLLASLVAEHQPQGPTEEHLVEELAGILWRKRRLRLAEAAAHRRGLENSFSDYRYTAKAALAHVTNADKSLDVSEAVHITPEDAEEELRDLNDDEAMTRHALEILESQRNDAYGSRWPSCGTTRRAGGRIHSNLNQMNSKRTKNPLPRTSRGCAVSLWARCCPGSRSAKRRSVGVRYCATKLLASRSIPTSSSTLAVTRST
jgi:hypothetical protein